MHDSRSSMNQDLCDPFYCANTVPAICMEFLKVLNLCASQLLIGIGGNKSTSLALVYSNKYVLKGSNK